MNLLQNLLANGQTFTVSNVKGEGSIEDKLTTVVKVKLPASTKTTLVYDLTMIIKDGESKFLVGQNWFDSVPGLDVKGTGLAPIFYDDFGFLYVCTEGVENPLNNMSPLFLNNKKAAKKSLTFKSNALEYVISKVKSVNLTEDGTHHFNLRLSDEQPNLYFIDDASVELTVNVEDLQKQESVTEVKTSLEEITTIDATATITESIEKELEVLETTFTSDVLDQTIAVNDVVEVEEIKTEPEFFTFS